MGLPSIVDNMSHEDYVMIVQDGCIKMISKEDYLGIIIRDKSFICSVIDYNMSDMGCFPEYMEEDSGMGCFGNICDNTPKPNVPSVPRPKPTNKPPKFENLIYEIENRKQGFVIPKIDFDNHYTDEDSNSRLSKVMIVGGNTERFYFKGKPIKLGLVINRDDLGEITYDARDTDDFYEQALDIVVYTDKNIRAIEWIRQTH